MNVYFDNIINNIPVPNGVSSKSSIDAFINDKRYFSKETILVIPEFIRILKDYINLKKTNDAGKGVYPISIYQPSALTKQYCKYLIRFLIPKTTKNKILKNELKLIIHLDEEPCGENNFFNLLDELIYNNILNFKIYSRFIPKKFDEKYKSLSDKILPSCKDECFEFFRHIDFKINNKKVKNKSDGKITDKFDHDKQKHIKAAMLCHNNLNYDFRSAAVYSVLKRNLDKNCIITYNSNLKPISNFTNNAPLVQKILRFHDFQETVEKTYFFIDKKDIINTKLLLCVEAYLDNNIVSYPLPTEKTTLGFHSKKPFVVLGQKHTLKELKRKGYKTFHPFINESYDDIDNNDNRFFQVIKEFEKLLLLSEDDFLKFVDNTKKITEHNFKNFSNMVNEFKSNYTNHEFIF
tara:strand:+ start:3484 stop:4701 length:1218 start_codon:yes stop_codon:yes gene_type:complete